MFCLFYLFTVLINQASAETAYSADVYLSRNEADVPGLGVNPENRVLELPSNKTQIELRPTLRLREDSWQAIVRPQLWINSQEKTILNEKQKVSKNKFDITDAFLEKNWSSFISTTVGLQVYQWGPAEFFNASNPFSHTNSQQKNLLYKEKGRGLLRANISFNKENSLVVAVEPISNQEPEFIAEDTFATKGFVKYEKSWSGTLNSIGVTAGVAEKNNIFFAEYFNWAINDIFSLYADFKHQKDQVNYRPMVNGAFYDMVASDPDENQWATLGVAGVRIEHPIDIRFEYIYNSAGYDLDQTDEAIAAASNFFNPNYARNVRRFFRPGLEILGRQYFYTSFRLTDPALIQNFSFYLRWLHSFQDQTAQVQTEIEKSFFDSWTVYAGQTLGTFETHSSTSEFRLVQTGESFLGLKYSF